jgi:hypothetical protein
MISSGLGITVRWAKEQTVRITKCRQTRLVLKHTIVNTTYSILQIGQHDFLFWNIPFTLWLHTISHSDRVFRPKVEMESESEGDERDFSY